MSHERPPARPWSTLLVWTLHLVCVGAALGFAATFVMMATSLDPLEMVNAGAEPWTNALTWTLTFLGVVIASVIGLVLWHSRLRWAGVILLAAEIGGIMWAGIAIYDEYF